MCSSSGAEFAAPRLAQRNAHGTSSLSRAFPRLRQRRQPVPSIGKSTSLRGTKHGSRPAEGSVAPVPRSEHLPTLEPARPAAVRSRGVTASGPRPHQRGSTVAISLTFNSRLDRRDEIEPDQRCPPGQVDGLREARTVAKSRDRNRVVECRRDGASAHGPTASRRLRRASGGRSPLARCATAVYGDQLAGGSDTRSIPRPPGSRRAAGETDPRQCHGEDTRCGGPLSSRARRPSWLA